MPTQEPKKALDRSQDWLFSVVEKAEVIDSATAEKSEWMTLVIWDLLGVALLA